MNDGPNKVTAKHLERRAYLYVRQSTLRQVFENTESTQRQYELRRRAVALGWAEDQIVVIDSDLGQSGASAADREGFQRLVTEVGLGRAGIVMGLEVSRLARNSTDWHRLLELCALADTLILDEDGVYDPAHFNDRLLLGLKGTMSEAELHVLKARLRGGALNKARRGELGVPLPVGFVVDPAGRVQLDPDAQVRESVTALFRTFGRTGSALQVVREFRAQGWKFPSRARWGPHQGELLWRELGHCRVLQVLHNPRYAGVYVFGRTRGRRLPGGPQRENLPREEWIAFRRDAHPAYITWDEYESNLVRLRENASSRGPDRRHGPPREGPALLQGLALCGRCGDRMTVRYHTRHGQVFPTYVCQRKGIERAEKICQSVPGFSLDAAIGRLLLESLTPQALEATLAVQREAEQRTNDATALRSRQVERARYEADLARRRFVQVDPENRLVADALEAEWNAKLRELAAAREECERRQAQHDWRITEVQQNGVRSLAADFPRIWNNPNTSDRDRKRMTRLLVEDVTVVKSEDITVQLRFRGGTSRVFRLPKALAAPEACQPDQALVAEIDRLLDAHCEGAIASLLEAKGYRTGRGKPLTRDRVMAIRRSYQLRSRHDRLRDRGMLPLGAMAVQLGISTATLQHWRRAGRVEGQPFNDRGECLFMPPGADAPVKYEWHRRRSAEAARRRKGSIA